MILFENRKRKQRFLWIGCVGLMMGILVSCGTENEPTYTLTTIVTPDGIGTIEPASGEYTEGEVVTITASTSSAGWQFNQWGGDWNDNTNPTTITMTRDYSVIGVFERHVYNLEVLVEGQGSVTETIVSQPSGDYLYETVVELVATPEGGWLFSRWEGDASGSTNPLSVTIDGSKSVTAVFEQDPNFGRDTETEVVDVINPTTGVTWMDRNLGASRAATGSTDSEAYGDLYQWGRAADGHEKRTSGTTNTRSTTDQPGHGDFIIGSTDWRSPKNDNLWQGADGVNNPCPVGYRLPTEAEWNAERTSWSSNNRSGAIASPLKLPVAGYRYDVDGSLRIVGSYGYYWSSSVGGTNARRLLFDSINAIVYSYFRANGHSVRCLKD